MEEDSLLKKTQIHALTSRLCDGDIASQELDHLNALLKDDPKAIAEYRAHTDLHLQLSQEIGPAPSIPTIAKDLATGSQSAAERMVKQEVTCVARESPFTKIGAKWKTLLAVAATLLFVSGYGISVWISKPDFTARILTKINCDWDQEHWGTPQFAALDVGQEIEIKKGLLVLEFGNGAEVTLEAQSGSRSWQEIVGN